jgi:hypothetical protein
MRDGSPATTFASTESTHLGTHFRYNFQGTCQPIPQSCYQRQYRVELNPTCSCWASTGSASSAARTARTSGSVPRPVAALIAKMSAGATPCGTTESVGWAASIDLTWQQAATTWDTGLLTPTVLLRKSKEMHLLCGVRQSAG